ncbi:MAG: phosphoglycerate dehydrogenase [Longimicrobiales bacterium]|nr:phosphoglycerate dehydrogenase [Longimicrobiales bacterium]
MPFRILVTDEIDPKGVALLRDVPEFQVDELPTLPAAEILERIGDYDALVGRSATRVTPELLRGGRRLKVVGRAGVGVDNIAMGVATELGIAVINAPAGNTVAVAELFFGSVISLLRGLTRADASMHEGRWERSQLLGSELKGRMLGIVGLGRIGSEVAHRAHAFGMGVMAFDPYVGTDHFTALRVRRAADLDELLREADVVTVHTPLTDETRGLVGGAQLARLKDGAVLVNMARGGIVDDPALLEALESGRLGGAVLDVFVTEPLTGEHLFQNRSDALLTPHIGASTREAQRNVAVDVCAGVRDALLRGDLSRSLNAALDADVASLASALQLARRAAVVGRALLAERGASSVTSVTVKTGHDLVPAAAALLSAAAVGVLEGVVDVGRVNLINARSVADARGIVLATGSGGVPPHSRALEVRLAAEGGHEIRVGGVAAVDAPPRLSRIGDFHVDVVPRGTLLVLANDDVPGVIGHVGTVLGEAGMNIGEYHQARVAPGGEALAVVSLDGEPGLAVRAALLALPHVRSATLVRFHEGFDGEGTWGA